MANLIIFGGTFDPIHNGHIKIAINVQKHFNFDRFLFLPCKIPILKNQTRTSTKDRIAMLKLCLAEQDKTLKFELDLSEITRESPSYMVETLSYFRNLLGENFSLTLLVGRDSFNQFPQWHNWKQLINLANILVIERPDLNTQQIPVAIKKLLHQHETKNDKALSQQSNGLIYCYNAGHYAISSSWIREQLLQNKNMSKFLSFSVQHYIQEHNLYKLPS